MLAQLLQSALELVHSRQDLPGRLLAFCLCNLIVAVLIVSRHTASPPPRASGPNTARETDALATLFLGVSAADVGGYVNDGLEVAAAGGGWAEEHDGVIYDQEGNGEPDQVDRRAEEFIAQMNRVWREELRRDRQHNFCYY